MKSAVQPPVRGGLHPGRTRFHEILCVEMRACGVRRAGSMDDSQVALLPQGLKRGYGRMQAEEAVEVNHRASRDIDGWAHGVVGRVGMRHDNVQTVRGAALEDYDQAFVLRSGFLCAVCGASEESRYSGRAHDGKRAVPQKYASRNCHKQLLSG